MSDHSSIVGGSTATRVIKCNASIDLNKHAPGEEWNEASATGTALHWVVEEVINTKLQMPPSGYIGREKEQITLTEDHINDKAIPAIQYYKKVKEECGGFEELYVEEKVGFGQLDTDDDWYIEGAFGTADIIFDDGVDRCGIIDWKFGDGLMVSAEDNDQMRFYLAAAIASSKLPEIEEYEAHIFQPAARLDPSDYASVAIYTYEELEEFILALKESVEGERTFNVGPHCRFCKGKINCSALLETMHNSVETDIDTMDAHELSRYLKMAPTMTQWMKDLRKTAQRNAQNGVLIPGFKLDTTYGNRKYRDEDKASAYIQRHFGIPMADRTNKKLKSPAQIEKLLKECVKDEENETTEVDVIIFMNKHVTEDEYPDTLVECKTGEENLDSQNMAEAFSKIMTD